MSRTLTPAAVISRQLELQIPFMLRDGETVQARLDANGRFAGWLECLPLVRHLLEMVRGRFELVATNRRFIAIRVSRLSRRVKSCRTCPIHHMLTLKQLMGPMQSELRFRFADGKVLSFCRIGTPDANAFLDRFPEGSLAHALASTLNEPKPMMANPVETRINYRTPAA